MKHSIRILILGLILSTPLLAAEHPAEQYLDLGGFPYSFTQTPAERQKTSFALMLRTPEEKKWILHKTHSTIGGTCDNFMYYLGVVNQFIDQLEDFPAKFITPEREKLAKEFYAISGIEKSENVTHILHTFEIEKIRCFMAYIELGRSFSVNNFRLFVREILLRNTCDLLEFTLTHPRLETPAPAEAAAGSAALEAEASAAPATTEELRTAGNKRRREAPLSHEETGDDFSSKESHPADLIAAKKTFIQEQFARLKDMDRAAEIIDHINNIYLMTRSHIPALERNNFFKTLIDIALRKKAGYLLPYARVTIQILPFCSSTPSDLLVSAEDAHVWGLNLFSSETNNSNTFNNAGRHMYGTFANALRLFHETRPDSANLAHTISHLAHLSLEQQRGRVNQLIKRNADF